MAGIEVDVCYGVGVNREHVRVTVELPADLVAQADELVRDGFAHSLNELLGNALKRELRRIEGERIDDQIRAMANDPDLLELEEQIMREFAESDAETARTIPD